MSRRNVQYGSYTQLDTLNAEPFACVRNEQSNPLITPKRTHFTRRDCILVVIVILVACVMIAVTLSLGLPKIREKRAKYLDTSFPASPSIINTYRNAAVVSDGGPCASIGRQILIDNGTAVDAAIATLFCDGAVNPQSMGLGGGFFMIVYNTTSKTAKVIDARDIAPSKATVDMFHGNETLSTVGGLSVAVPGELRGYALAHQHFGSLDWKSLVYPTVKLCVNGFPVGRHLASKLALHHEEILAEPSMRDIFFNKETNDLYKEGEIIKRPILAKTLDTIAKEGPNALYNGSLTKHFVADIQTFGGIIEMEDMAKYTPLLKDAIVISNENGALYSVPPPGSGAILGLILNILRGYNMNEESIVNVSSAALTYHRMIEAFKFAYARRMELGDNEESNVLIRNWDNSFAEAIRRNISDITTYPPEHYGPIEQYVDDHGTAQVSVLTSNGIAVSATSTVNTVFGSMRCSKSTGIILNNNMDDFSSPNVTNFFGLPPTPANFIAPGKRPMSSMSPNILVDEHGNVRMVMGAAGGSRIPTALSQVLMRMLWFKEDVKQSIDALRLHHQLYPNHIEYEEGFPKIYLDHLKQFGHKIEPSAEDSVVLGILRDETGIITTNVDYRKGGSSQGL